MSTESRNNQPVDTIHRHIRALLSEVDRFRQHPTVGAWVPGLEAMLQQLKDLLDMELTVETENHLDLWIQVCSASFQGIKNDFTSAFDN